MDSEPNHLLAALQASGAIETPPPDPAAARRRLAVRLAFGAVLAAAAIVLAFNRHHLDAAWIESLVGDLGPWAPVVFIAIYAVATVLFVPGVVFTLAGGALFGPVWGVPIDLAGATLGATGGFLVARTLAADLVRRRAGPRLERLIAGVETEGWRFVAFVRLVPVFPFNLLNYGLGLTRIRLSHYILASAVCMAPSTIAYTWLGHAGREALEGQTTAIRYGLLALAVLAAVGYLPRLLLKRPGGPDAPRWLEPEELARRLDAGDGTALVDVRGPDEFAGPLGHVAGATNLPLDMLPGRLRQALPHPERPVVLMCLTDKRSARAAALLREAGFRDVSVLRGGLKRWREASLPVVAGG
jgi:uncharacterized membrane protein YdjX (TVP38/TMEM64 family)/rhodanese-related sulfurtransferase